jgi:multiple sugar transport system substrate-binding protein
LKTLFFFILGILTVFSFYILLSQPEQQTDRPVIYWKSDANPQRVDQIKLFNQWLVKHSYVDSRGRPVVELKLDSANSQSKLIQAVSGVGGDIMDAVIPQFQPMGVLTDLSKDAKELDFGVNRTYPGLTDSLLIDGKQYGYPCNVNVAGLWCNADTFKRFNMAPPPEIWNFQKFEDIGKEFVKRANAGKKRQEIFFGENPVGSNGETFLTVMYRSMGLDDFNETRTRCILNDSRYIDVLKLIYKWTYQDHLFPSAAEESSMSSEAGYGSSSFAHFQSGKYAMIITGRWCLIRMREFNNIARKTLSRFPQKDFQNMQIAARTATLYAGSRHKKYARLFFAFLADREYNNNIISGADGLPPTPEYVLGNPDFENPPDHPDEAEVNKTELKWAQTIALSTPYSPYFKTTGINWKKYGIDKYFNQLASAEDVAAEIQQRINASILETVNSNPELKKQYDMDTKIQQQIDEYKAAGKKIPVKWIKNSFHLKYYRSINMLEEKK